MRSNLSNYTDAHYEYANSTDLRELFCEALNLLIDEDRANLSFGFANCSKELISLLRNRGVDISSVAFIRIS